MTNTITANNLKPSSMIFLSIQHVLVMYAGAVSIPLIVGGALGLSTAEIAFLITADLFVCGIATLIQTKKNKNGFSYFNRKIRKNHTKHIRFPHRRNSV